MSRLSPATLALLITALFALVSCKSSPKTGIPKNLPKIKVSSSAAPPKHNMNRGEYPFDERGNYVSAWAAEGSRGGGNIPAPQVESPIELPSPEPERPSKSKSRSGRMVISTTPPPLPQPSPLPPPPSHPAPTPTVRTTPPPPPPPPINPTPTVTSSSTPARKPTTSSSSTAKPKPKPPAKPSSSTLSYTVKSGDTLYALALRYKSSVAKIKSASGISSDKLKIGQKLRIPR